MLIVDPAVYNMEIKQNINSDDSSGLAGYLPGLFSELAKSMQQELNWFKFMERVGEMAVTMLN